MIFIQIISHNLKTILYDDDNDDDECLIVVFDVWFKLKQALWNLWFFQYIWWCEVVDHLRYCPAITSKYDLVETVENKLDHVLQLQWEFNGSNYCFLQHSLEIKESLYISFCFICTLYILYTITWSLNNIYNFYVS